MNIKRNDLSEASSLAFDTYLNGLTYSSLKVLTLFGSFLYAAFLALDYVVAPPELFPSFALYRFMACGLVFMLYIVLRLSRPGRYTFLHGYLATVIATTGIVLMIVRLGGFNSGYYAGLNLVIIGINLLITWHYVHSAVNSLFVVALYAAANFIFGKEFSVTVLIANLFFMLSTVFFAIIISFMRYNLTKREFMLRQDLAGAQVDEINELAGIAQRVASGDLSVTIEKRSKDTAGILEAAFDTMISDLRGALMNVKDMAGLVAGFVHDIKTRTDSMEQGSREQLEQTTRSGATIQQMTETIMKNSATALQTDEMADRAIASASRSGEFVDKAVRGMNLVAEVVKQSADKVQSLGQSSKRISEIILVINEIADRTNLLALNAAIEAARAGEQGKGFAIVADEVGKLSDRTAQAIKEITEMIQIVLADIGEAVSTMDRANREVDTSILHVREMHASMKEIIELSNNLRGMISQIASASRSENDAAAEINRNITSINEIALNLAGYLKNISQSIGEMNAHSTKLEDTVRKFKLN
jgi:methyl-accepting chemotaxis protein